jgi:TonB family protein
VNREPAYFVTTERLTLDGTSEDRKRRQRSLGASGSVHVLIFVALVVGPMIDWFPESPYEPGNVVVRFYEHGDGPSGGGGGGGSSGERITAYIPVTLAEPQPSEVEPEPRSAPVAPRKPRPLSYDNLNVPDIPTDTDILFEGVFSPDATDIPGLSLTDARDFGGLDTTPSSGAGGGIGAGIGTGVGTGEGWGVGPGRDGGFGGGDYRPGGWDIEPVVVFKPPVPAYPDRAREKMVRGEVILEILVELDGSTRVLKVIKSLPFCVEAAKEHAKLWRWKPALKDGKPMETVGIITVQFDLFAQSKS